VEGPSYLAIRRRRDADSAARDAERRDVVQRLEQRERLERLERLRQVLRRQRQDAGRLARRRRDAERLVAAR
jgi:hypothetical protein